MVALEEYRSSSLAAGQRRRKSAGASLTSTPKNRVWGFADSPSGRPCAELDLSWETATGSVQYTYKTASGRAEFLSRDPLGFKAGPNMYTYVRQNPWTHFDPEGLDNNPPPPPPPPPPSQHAPPPKQTTPQGSTGAGGWHKDVTVGPADSSTSKSSPPVASAKTPQPAKGGEKGGESNTETAGQVLDVAGGTTEIGQASNLKVMSNVNSGAWKTYTTDFYGNKSVSMLANVGKASEIAGKILKPLGYASVGVGAVNDAKAAMSGKESIPVALAKTAWGAAGLVNAHAAVAQGGFAAGQLIDKIPMSGGRTVGENLQLGIQRVIAPSSVEPR